MITRGEQMLALRKRRMAKAPPFLRGGFRPFFFGAGAWAVIAITLWLGQLAGLFQLPSAFDGVAWHRHEMLFGFVGAAVSGFLLTAIPNWTGRLPIAGTPLLSLFGLWALARLAVLFSSITGFLLAATLDVGFYLCLAVLAAREVIASKKTYAPVVALVFAFAVADAADYADTAGSISGGLGWRAAIAIMVLMISVIGGRIIPSFTRNWLAKSEGAARLPVEPQSLDALVIASTAIGLVFWLVFARNPLTGYILVLAAAAQLLRLSRWSGHLTWSDPLLLVLHVGYLWMPIGLLLLGLSIARFDIPESAGVHALTAGAMATMILAVMSRASLGHTARKLEASSFTVMAYVSVTVGASLRVAASVGVGPLPIVLDIAGAFWGLALLLFVFAYISVLWGPRVGDQR